MLPKMTVGVSQAWRRLAGVLLVVGGLFVLVYGGFLTGEAPWTLPLPFLGSVPVVPILIASVVICTGIGVLRGAAWARMLGLGLAGLELVLDAFAVAASLSPAVVIDVAASGLTAFALAFRWAPPGQSWRTDQQRSLRGR